MVEALKSAWLSGRGGTLGARGEAFAWALRKAWYAQGNGDYGLLQFVRGHVQKLDGSPPHRDTLAALFIKIDADNEWYPGKVDDVGGRPRALSSTNEAIVARSLMAYKRAGGEPTYPVAIAHNPNATRNHATGEPVNKKAVYTIMEERCYDDDENPEDTWQHQARNAQTALTSTQVAERALWADWMLELNHQGAWLFRKLVWTDICNKIKPLSERKANEQALARKAKKGWGSSKSKNANINLVGKQESIKQNSWGTMRVYYAPVLARGKLHTVLLGDDFPGETPAGAAQLVAKVRASLNIRFRGDDQPDVVFTDRGQGFYRLKSGKITPEYATALRENGLTAFMGADASKQPGDLKDLMLHETAVAWLTNRLQVTTPARAWEETTQAFGARLKAATDYINAHYDVEGLQRQLPARLQKLKDREGGRIGK